VTKPEPDEFQWDYSYFKWHDIPTWVVADVSKQGARVMYNKNWDGCRDLWKENYRRMKLRRFYTDRPITPPDPERLQYEREKAKADRFNHAQQKRYEQWLKKRKAAE